MCVFVVASGHAPLVLELAEAPFHGVARLVPFRVVGLGVQTPVPGRNDGLNALLFQPGAEGVAVVGPVREQAGQGRAGSGLDQGPGLGAVVARAARQVQTQGASPLIRQDVVLGAEAAPAATEGGIPSPFLGRAAALAYARTTVLSSSPRGQFRIGLQVGHPARTDAPITPGGPAAIDRVPLSVLGRQSVPGGARPRHPAQRSHEKTAMRFIHGGPSSRAGNKGIDLLRITAGVQDVPFRLKVAVEAWF